eukprot:228081_1
MQKELEQGTHATKLYVVPPNSTILGCKALKRLGYFDKQQPQIIAKSKHFHEIDGMEKFETNPRFRFSNYNQTIMHSNTFKIKRGTLKNFDHCIGSTKLDFKNKNVTMHYFELRVDKVPTCGTFIGISSSNIRNGTPYRRIPVIAAWGINCGQLSHSEFPVGQSVPPSVNETMGILLDFKSKEWNGAIRIFKNKKELMMNGRPFIDNLFSKSYVWAKIPPVSLYIGNYYTSKFKFTIKQFPFIPNKYKTLFPPYYTERQKLTH